MINSILIVDDKPEDLTLVEMVLKDVGFNGALRTATSGRDAIQEAKVFLPDFVILDLVLPDIDGMEVCKEIKALLPDVKIAILTGQFEKIDPLKAFESGSDDFIAKADSYEAIKGIFAKFNKQLSEGN